MVKLIKRAVFTDIERSKIDRALKEVLSLEVSLKSLKDGIQKEKLLIMLDTAISNVDQITYLRTPLYNAYLKIKEQG